MSHRGIGRAMDDLVAAGVVWPAKLGAYCTWHMLYREHPAADLVVALADLDRRLARRVADHVAAWQPPAHTVALRLPCPAPPADLDTGPPCPDVADHHPAAAAIDLLVTRPRGHDGDPTGWDDHASDLATAIHHWSGNPVHLHLRDPTETTADDDHDTADWWLLAGTAVVNITAHPRNRPRRPNRRSGPATATPLADVRTAAAVWSDGRTAAAAEAQHSSAGAGTWPARHHRELAPTVGARGLPSSRQ